jgi:hypothetical protein
MLKRGNETMKRPLVALASLLLAQALAQVDLALSPARLEFVLPPGGEVTESVRVRNGLDWEEALSVALRPFTLTPQGDVAESPERNLCPHLTATPTAFTVPPRGTAEVRLTLKAPPGAEGTLACLVVFTAQPRPTGLGGLRITASPSLGLAVYLTLRGTERPALRARVGGEGKALPVLLENPGNVLQRVTGEARVFDGEGKEVARLPIAELPVFPGGYREFALEPEAPLPPGRYRVVLILESAYGRYAAEGVWAVP